MNPSDNNTRGRGRGSRLVVLVCVVLMCIIVGVVLVRRQPRGPKLLNQPTRAREARPLTTEPDSRFAPLPLEREKHGK